MIVSLRTTLLTHGVVFIGGCVLGKMINQDELETYRSIHESSITKFRRGATTAAFAILSVGTIYFAARIVSKSTRAVRDE
jgi:hypothetical protein